MIKISNHNMRLLWLKSNGLASISNQKLDVLQIIKNLGFVQLDSIQNVSRAYHHILWSRNEKYKEHMLDDLLLDKGNIFEHFTHDASILPPLATELPISTIIYQFYNTIMPSSIKASRI